MNNQEHGPVYDIPNNDRGRRILYSGLLSVANGLLVGSAVYLAQIESEYSSMATKFVVALHGFQVFDTVLQIARDLRTPDFQLPDGGVMVHGWRERLALRNFIYNFVPLVVSAVTYASLTAGNTAPLPPLPTPGGEIQV